MEAVSVSLPAEGGCQCGEVRYRVTGEPLYLTICHCLECQRQSGSAFAMSLRLRAADVQLIHGEPKTWTRPSDVGGPVACRFCATCGTRVWHEPSTPPGFIHIKSGTLDDPSQLAPQYESWTIRKHPWLAIAGLDTSFETQPPRRER